MCKRHNAQQRRQTQSASGQQTPPKLYMIQALSERQVYRVYRTTTLEKSISFHHRVPATQLKTASKMNEISVVTRLQERKNRDLKEARTIYPWLELVSVPTR